MSDSISIRHFLPTEGKNSWVRHASPVLDSVLGISKLNRFYQKNQFHGKTSEEFMSVFIQSMGLGLRFHVDGQRSDFESSLSNIPESGPALIVSNHPLGGAEGIALTHWVTRKRRDTKVLVNKTLSVFSQMDEHFIYTNPFVSNAKGNIQSLKQCMRHLKDGGVLVLFPAGKVSASETPQDRVTDAFWNKQVGLFINKFKFPVVPIHISGKNSKLFYKLGHIHFRLRAAMLIRELLKSRGKKMNISIGNPIDLSRLELSDEHATALSRLATYLQEEIGQVDWPKAEEIVLEDIAPKIDNELLQGEVASIHDQQCLVEYKHYATYYTRQEQTPNVVDEIRRLREVNFRLMDEGSGKPVDGDEKDRDYLHLFVFDHKNQRIVGAYRMGPTDELSSKNVDVYLNQMFDFKQGFVNQTESCLEMGRSFIIAEEQKSFYGLLMLFKGIGSFVAKYPRYETLYGTVSISKQYSPLSAYLIQRFLIKSQDDVRALEDFEYQAISHIKEEVSEFLESHSSSIDELDLLIQMIEPDGKGVPVLVKQYHNLGAKFYSLGIDPNFATTPGLLLSVHVPTAPKKLLKLYLGNKLQDYLDEF